MDSDDHEVPTGTIGELCIRSNSMTIGYWQDPEHTAQTIRDGWLHSGDEGRIDEEDNIWFVGRDKEIIVKRGSNIAPGEVESVLDEHPDIAETAVVGTPPGKHGQRVVAFVETEKGHTLDTDAVNTWATQRIATFKLPDEWVLVDALPRNAVGKLDRAELHRRSKSLFPDG
jgi:acyl-CoA synthetase (AMP-forming)/AMP-acid ligase II